MMKPVILLYLLIAVFIAEAQVWARVNNVDISGYGPGCGGGSGGNSSAYSPLRPGEYRLDPPNGKTRLNENRNLVIVAAPPRDPEAVPGRCLAYNGGGRLDDCDKKNEPCGKKYQNLEKKFENMFSQSVFYIADRCPGCREQINETGEVTHKQRIDIPMSCSLMHSGTGFKFKHANFKVIECPSDLQEKIAEAESENKKPRVASRRSRRVSRVAYNRRGSTR